MHKEPTKIESGQKKDRSYEFNGKQNERTKTKKNTHFQLMLNRRIQILDKKEKERKNTKQKPCD